ncbi:MAG: LapA family protein [Desulfuromonadales bacterium]|nr:LapA family protein [Desulfuromonadales bacterium]
MKTFKLLVAIFVLALLLVFSAYNAQPVHIRVPGWHSGELPLFLPIVFCFLLGFLVAALLSTVRTSQLRRQIHQLEREASALRREAEGELSGTPGSNQKRT